MQAVTITATQEQTRPAPGAGFFDTYGVSYALGLLFLLPAIVLIGSQPLYSFTLFYTTMLTIPPIAATVILLMTDPVVEDRHHIPSRSALLVVLAITGSILALIAGTPVVIFMFNYGVGHSQAITGLISSAGLAFVSAPMVWSLVSHVRAGSWLRVGILLLGIVAMLIVILLTLSSGGVLVDSMRRDQGEIMMGLLEWCLPAFAVTTGYIRRNRLI